MTALQASEPKRSKAMIWFDCDADVGEKWQFIETRVYRRYKKSPGVMYL